MGDRKDKRKSDHKSDYERLIFEAERRNARLKKHIEEMKEQIDRLKAENGRLAAELKAAKEGPDFQSRTPPTKSKAW